MNRFVPRTLWCPFPKTRYAKNHRLRNIGMTFDSATRAIHHILRSRFLQQTTHPCHPKNPPPHLDDQLHLQIQYLRTGVTSSPVVGLHFSCQLEFSTTMTLTMPPHTIPQQHRPCKSPKALDMENNPRNVAASAGARCSQRKVRAWSAQVIHMEFNVHY